ncbi:hypothetical protein [[Pseudomonas] boreopolis]|uniref:hypothetical protein n=1 Tax=Xanthomonas boreopolis TaxID=86183 RepID=UPI003D9AFEF7
MISHDQPFGCCEALLLVTFLYAAHPCAAPFGPASPCGAAPAARVHKQRKVTRRKAKAFALSPKAKESKAKSLDDQPFGC